MVVHQAEAATDHRVTDLADRHRARHRARPAQPQQPVLAGEFVDGGAAVDPVDAVPQRDRLRVAQQPSMRPRDDDPLTQRTAVGAARRRAYADEQTTGPFGQQMPRPLTGLGCAEYSS